MSLNSKRHCHLIVWLGLIAVSLILGLGNQRIVAYSAQSNALVAQQGIYLAQAGISGLLSTLGVH